MPFIVADITRGTGRFNLSLGIVGNRDRDRGLAQHDASRLRSDHYGSQVAFLGLASIAATGLALISALMPETAAGE